MILGPRLFSGFFNGCNGVVLALDEQWVRWYCCVHGSEGVVRVRRSVRPYAYPHSMSKCTYTGDAGSACIFVPCIERRRVCLGKQGVRLYCYVLACEEAVIGARCSVSS